MPTLRPPPEAQVIFLRSCLTAANARSSRALARCVEDFIGTPRQMFINGQWVDAASGKTFEARRMTPSERGRIVWKIGDLILQHVDELAQLESLDNGKPFLVAQAADVPLAADGTSSRAGAAKWAMRS